MQKHKVILLVEDNPVDEELTIRAFERNNIKNTIVVAHDGVEALDYMFGTGKHENRNTDEKPQLVLLDLKLPKVDGLEVLKKIRESDSTKHTPVVVLTSSKEQRDIVQAYDLGTNAYVQKPIDFNEFVSAVQQLGLFWLILNEYPGHH